MSHGIQEHDRGIVCGKNPTWHGMEQYIHQPEGWADHDAAREILDYPLEKRQLTRTVTSADGTITTSPSDAYEIIRTDIQPEIVLVDAVGKRFEVLNNAELFDAVKRNVLDKNPDVQIESVGTLFNGQIAFVNMIMDKWEYKGDRSEQQARIMYFNPLGLGKYKVGAHTIRIECFNTLSAASSQSEINTSAQHISHTKSAGEKIAEEVNVIAEYMEKVKTQKALMEELINIPAGTKTVGEFMNAVFPTDTKKDRVNTNNHNRREEIMEIFIRYQRELTGSTSTSMYALAQAMTEWVDKERSFVKGDWNYRKWQGLAGQRAKDKKDLFDKLCSWCKIK